MGMEGGCPSPTQGGDCATHLDTGSQCSRQGIRHVWFATGMGGDTAALVSAPAGRSDPPGDSGRVILTQTRGAGAAAPVWGQRGSAAVGLRAKGLWGAGHQANRGEELARRGC